MQTINIFHCKEITLLTLLSLGGGCLLHTITGFARVEMASSTEQVQIKRPYIPIPVC